MNEKKLTVAGAKRRLREIESEIFKLDAFLVDKFENARFVVARANSLSIDKGIDGISTGLFSFELGARKG